MGFISFCEDSPKFFSDGAGGIYFKFLAEVGDVQTSGANYFPGSGFHFACYNFELRGFTSTIDTD